MPNLPPRITQRRSRTSWDRDRDTPRIRGTTLQHARARLFERQPLCVSCLEQQRVTPATIRDHIIPLAEGGSESEANTQALCEPCHEIKRIAEATRGLRRAITYGDRSPRK